LLRVKGLRDRAYKRYRKFGHSSDFHLYKELCHLHEKTNNKNLVEFFESKTSYNFSSSKAFWQFYSNLVSIKSDRSSQQGITSFSENGQTISEPKSIANIFNHHFVSRASTSTATLSECTSFIISQVNKLKSSGRLASSSFSFRPVNVLEVENAILQIPSTSAPGVSGIPTSIIQATSKSLAPAIAALINNIFVTGEIPLDWKSAIVTPLHKGKTIDQVENYRGISVLPPLDKVFEKLVGAQITDHFIRHKLLFSGQYGFRASHSCEAALHQVIDRMNRILSKKQIGMFLFVDFKSAFDVVHPGLLLTKLEHAYGFDAPALNLLSNFFVNRTQIVKYGGALSDSCENSLGVPQGSSLGPLLFLVFINDLPFFLEFFFTVLFADDTTLGLEDNNLEILLSTFYISTSQLLEWCKFNLIDINWYKTKVMFITNKRKITIPTFININGNIVEVVTVFKLLGVYIDNKLTFSQHVCSVKNNVNKRLFSFKRLFFLPLVVKLQFFKTFILPLFDYCSTICIYFPKYSIQKLANYYNLSIFKIVSTQHVLSFRPYTSSDFNTWNNILEYYGLNAFQHRTIYRLSCFIHKIFNEFTSPQNLFNIFVFNREVQERTLRNAHHLYIPDNSEFFQYFFSKLINLLYLNELSHSFKHFSMRVYNNINLIFSIFVEHFDKFDLIFKAPYIYTNK
jgi:hypothetical protein